MLVSMPLARNERDATHGTNRRLRTAPEHLFLQWLHPFDLADCRRHTHSTLEEVVPAQSWSPDRYAKNVRFVSDLGMPVVDLWRPAQRNPIMPRRVSGGKALKLPCIGGAKYSTGSPKLPPERLWPEGPVSVAQSTHGLRNERVAASKFHVSSSPTKSCCPQRPAPSAAVPTGAMFVTSVQIPEPLG